MVFSQAPGGTYLTVTSAFNVPAQTVTTGMSSGQSELILTISQINADGSAGQASVSGSLNSAPVSWTGPVDLTANPFTGLQLAGWPANAFSSQLNEASYFDPMFTVLAPPPPPAGQGPPPPPPDPAPPIPIDPLPRPRPVPPRPTGGPPIRPFMMADSAGDVTPILLKAAAWGPRSGADGGLHSRGRWAGHYRRGLVGCRRVAGR